MVKGSQRAHIVYSHHSITAFLNIPRICTGHLLVVPRRLVEELDMLSAEDDAHSK